ncbi:permease [Cystobacter fuscus]|uniref:Probable membrane transporter protein n=1 Tax=Cystobacter fuscus TaxID=43 RepID=A0A250JCZ6_9BACT|nr:sulfite exporter TauE/SafE family protein [Cystobacter fuscus]ATB41784.1 permease [Cystobacter fuscus]
MSPGLHGVLALFVPPAMPLVGFALAALIGVSLGLLGGGGSILTVPILVYVLGFEPKESIAMGLAIVGTTSLFGAIGHWRAGNLQLRAALVFGAMAMGGTFVGARLSVFLPGTVQLVLFATVMLVAAVFMARNARRELTTPATGAEPRAASFPLIAASALGVGALTGLVGVGGGFLIVPVLVLRVGLPMKQAVGTSLLVIAFNSFVGFAGYLGHVNVAWGALTLFTGLAIAGSVGGTWLSRFISQATLKRAFAGLLVVMGVLILYENRRTFPSLGRAAAMESPRPARPG